MNQSDQDIERVLAELLDRTTEEFGAAALWNLPADLPTRTRALSMAVARVCIGRSKFGRRSRLWARLRGPGEAQKAVLKASAPNRSPESVFAGARR